MATPDDGKKENQTIQWDHFQKNILTNRSGGKRDRGLQIQTYLSDNGRITIF